MKPIVPDLSRKLSFGYLVHTSRLLVIFCLLFTFGFQTSPAQASIPPASQLTNGNAPTSHPTISADGRIIAFASFAENLVEDDTNQVADIFIYDLQTGTIERISKSSSGEQANADSVRPAISANGRVIAFESLASNLVPGDTNRRSDIFVYDRLMGSIERVSVNLLGDEGNHTSLQPSISGDGRMVAFLSLADNLFPGDGNGVQDAFVYDRLTDFQQRISFGPDGEDADDTAHSVTINPNGTSIAFITSADNILLESPKGTALYSYNTGIYRTAYVAPAAIDDRPSLSTGGQWLSYRSNDAPHDHTIYIFDQYEKSSYTAQLPVTPLQHTISGDGRYLIAIGTADGTSFTLYRHHVLDGTNEILAEGVSNQIPTVSQDGQVIAYVQEVNGIPQIMLLDLREKPFETFTIDGRVSSPLGDPLAEVTIRATRGFELWQTETNQDGYFFLGGIPNGPVTITPSKTGFTFSPESTQLSLDSDISELSFTYAIQEVLDEARLDIGMPYDHRCEDGQACQGEFHGYSSGQCTDLVLDAFTWGAEYNIKLALRRDEQAHPEHFYQSTNARDAYDMWRYFMYSGQMLSEDDAFLPGDMVFFDWQGNGEINHVSIVSQVDHNYHPTWLIDATGFTASNPSGLAAELPWEPFHEKSYRGHARWNGAKESAVIGMPPTDRLQVSVGSIGAKLMLLDHSGKKIAWQYDTAPNSSFTDLNWEQNLTVFQPEDEFYWVAVTNPLPESMPYYFVAQTVSGEELLHVTRYQSTLSPNSTEYLLLQTNDEGIRIRQSRWRGTSKMGR